MKALHLPREVSKQAKETQIIKYQREIACLLKKQFKNHRITELLRLEKTLKTLSPAINLALPSPPLNHVPMYMPHVHIF